MAALIEVAAMADAAGADELILHEHVVLAASIEDQPRESGASFSHPNMSEYPDPLVTFGAIAAVTRSARLATQILLASVRPAVVLAKAVATLDALSGGRLDLGIGSGWHRPELEACGVPPEDKVQR